MKAIIYIGIILCLRVVQSLYGKQTSNLVDGQTMFIRYTVFSKLVSTAGAFLLILITGDKIHFDLPTVFISLLTGLALVVSSFCSLMAMKSGTIVLSNMFSTAGLLIPSIVGIFLFGDKVSILQWAGVVVFLISAYLLIGGARTEKATFSGKTVLLLLGCLVANGTTMLAQRMFTYYVPKGSVSVYSFLSFGLSGILMMISLLPCKICAKGPMTRMPQKLYVYGAMLAIAVFLISQLATLSTALVPPVVLFTLINGGGLIIASIVGAIRFKEKPSGKSILGIILGLTSLIMIKL